MLIKEGGVKVRETITIKSIGKWEGKEVEIKGWLYNKRSSGKINFILIRDGTGIIQAVAVKGEVSDETFELCKSITQESSIIAKGVVRSDKRAPGGYELTLKELSLIQLAKDYPITPKEHGPDFLLDHRHLWLRSRRQHAIMLVRHRIIKACRDFLDNNGFVLIDTPILTPSACEGTTTLFATNYFDQTAYLTQSGQLYGEAACMAFRKIYCFGPTFRAEKSKTRRHLMEFWMVEPEMAFVQLDENMEFQEEFLSYIVEEVLKHNEEELKILERDTKPLYNIKPPFERLSYNEVVEILKKEGIDFKWGTDLGGTDETIISQKFNKPVFVHHFPAQVKAFYMQPDPEDPTLSLSVDMLAPEGYGEITGGGERIWEPEILKQRLEEHFLPMEAYKWYMDLRIYGSVPHSGFGLGIERTVAWICGLHHVRETIPFPRMLYRLYP